MVGADVIAHNSSVIESSQASLLLSPQLNPPTTTAITVNSWQQLPEIVYSYVIVEKALKD